VVHLYSGTLWSLSDLSLSSSLAIALLLVLFFGDFALGGLGQDVWGMLFEVRVAASAREPFSVGIRCHWDLQKAIE
jgi:hypothetical protein